MSEILKNAAHKAMERRRELLSPKEREKLRKHAQNTPYLDKMRAICNKAK